MRPADPAPEPAEEPLPASALPDGSEPHDPTGLGLAREVARAVGPGSRSRSRRPGRPRVDHRGVGPGPQVSGPRPDDRDPQRLGAAVERLVESKGWTTEVNVRSLLARWPALVGPVNAAHSSPESYTDTVLTVRTDSTAWATQLRLLASTLLARLVAELGPEVVTTLRITGPTAPNWKHGKFSVRGARGPRDTYG